MNNIGMWGFSITEHTLIILQLYTRCILCAVALVLLMTTSSPSFVMSAAYRVIFGVIAYVGFFLACVLSINLRRTIADSKDTTVPQENPARDHSRAPLSVLSTLIHGGTVSHAFFCLVCLFTSYDQWYELLPLMAAVWAACFESFSLFQAGMVVTTTDHSLMANITYGVGVFVKCQPVIVLISIYIQRVSNGTWGASFKAMVIVMNLLTFVPLLLFVFVLRKMPVAFPSHLLSWVLICVTNVIIFGLLAVYSVYSVTSVISS